MYGEIVFYTHDSIRECAGETVPVGELTADMLSFASKDYSPVQRLLGRMKV